MRLVLAILLTIAASVAANAQSTFTSQIHNACGWQPSTTYTYSAGPPAGHFTRVNNGAGWTPAGGVSPACITGGTYTAGSALNNYQLINTTSPCVSASSGGPSGTASDITDGTCHWQYVGPVDYVTFTGWGFDNGNVWASGNDYGYLDVTHTTDPNLPVFQQMTAGCHSTVKPTTGNINTQLADGCYWVGTMLWVPITTGQIYLTYSSNTNPVPMTKMNRDTFQGTVSGTTLCVTTPPATIPLAVNQYINFTGSPTTNITITSTAGTCGSGTPYTISATVTGPYTGTFFSADELNGIFGTDSNFYVGNVWNDREYVSNANGEANPIQTWNHDYQFNDGLHGILASPATTTAGYGWGYPMTIQAAAGESFVDTYAANSGLALAGYDANNGVAFRGVGVEGFGPSDNGQFISGMQFKSDTGLGLMLENRSGNNTVIHHNIIESGTGSLQAVNTGFDVTFYNNLIIAHGTTVALEMDYGGFVVNNTIVCASGTTCQSAVDMTIDWANINGTVVTNNLVFGFQHFTSSNFYNNQAPWATCTWNCATFQGTNNITDVASTDGVGFDSCTFPSGSGFVPCPGLTFVYSGSVQSYAVPFKTGYTYANTPSGTNYPTCGQYGASGIEAGTCTVTNSVSPSSVFVSWPGNYRIQNTSSAYGGAAAFPGFNTYIIQYSPTVLANQPCRGTWPSCNPNANSPDLFGNTRPVSGRYDVGAVEFGGLPPIITTPGKFFFRR